MILQESENPKDLIEMNFKRPKKTKHDLRPTK